MSKMRLLFKILIPPLIVSFGVGAVVYLYKTKPKVSPRSRPFMGTLVEVSPLKKQTRRIQIQTHGTVRAKDRTVLTPPIAGIVDYINPALVEGGLVQAEEVLVGIKPAANVNALYTELEAPFNSVVQAMNVSIEQYVTPGFALATLIGSDKAQVRIDLPLREIARLPLQNLPNYFGLPAKVAFKFGNKTQIWDAIVQRNLPELTEKGGMAQLMLEIRDPFQLQSRRNTADSPVPLFIGAFVDVTIPAQTFNNVFIIPAHALRDQNKVYLENEGSLEIRLVEVAYVKKDEVFISKGIRDGEKLITSPLKGAAPGLKIRVAGKQRGFGTEGGPSKKQGFKKGKGPGNKGNGLGKKGNRSKDSFKKGEGPQSKKGKPEKSES